MYTLLVFFTFVPLCHSEFVYPEFLYKTKNQQLSDINLESYCFYFYAKTFTRVYTLVPYCLRSSDVSTAESPLVPGESFESLYHRNVTSHALLVNRASLDIIEDYEIYLQHLQLNMTSHIFGTQIYHKCDPPLFGDACQFESVLDYDITNMVIRVFEWKKMTTVLDILGQTNGTCFEGFQCNGRSICLDWREVCNGEYVKLIKRDVLFLSNLLIYIFFF
jgi:hypothetical protein